MTSSLGVQQSDPIGHLLFVLAVNQLTSGVECQPFVWYLDDSTNGGYPNSVLSYVQRCITNLRRIDLEVSPMKTVIINVGLAAGKLLSRG